MEKRTLGRYVNEMRLKNNLSLRDLAKETGLSYSYIHSIENERVMPSRDVVVALSKGLEGALPDELLRLGGYLPVPEEKEDENNDIKPDVFSSRFQKIFSQSTWTEETLSIKTNIEKTLIYRWLRPNTYRTSNDQGPDIISVYKLAAALKVTPDYLSGYAEHPNEMASSAPRPKNLRHILHSESLVLDHIPLDDQVKEKLIALIYAVFDDK
ncbi:helix-turn-helix domain-containing protein [Salibacterium aidingense]|uniref:helix-turn-helix domain-containing protein n=1 Tax=Salibacterium aidingense TaxID=384933 RepID=UPI0003F9A2E2|nr:helix-turn-helix transcriptional regulator [Salibacterium aidingense]